MSSKTRRNEASAKAEKHVWQSVMVKRIAEGILHLGNVCIATHASRRSAPAYRKAEKESGEVFHSIKAWILSSPRLKNLKDPDAIITFGKWVISVIEVKWGEQGDRTDLKLGAKEHEKITNLRGAGSNAFCRVKGPVSKSKSAREDKTFSIGKHTLFVLLTDIAANSDLLPLLDEWQQAGWHVVNTGGWIGRLAHLGEVIHRRK